MMKRLLSPVTIAAVCAQILSILVILEVITPSESESINTAIVALLEMFKTFAVLNNPTDKKHF
jgi:hypothetical protein